MNPNISKGIIESISKLREDHEFEDFKVTVDGDIYSCHSLILAGCSDFFRCLLRSNMKEKKEMTVELINISSPIFQLILKSLYTGCDIVTKENVLEVWSAVHQLQIHFLIEHCEGFAVTHLSRETLDVYKEQAEYLQSEKVTSYIFNYILRNFELLRDTEVCLGLDAKYITSLIKSDRLQVSSEDIVLYFIVDWVNYGDFLKKKSDAIKAALAAKSRSSLLNTMLGEKTTQNVEKAKDENNSINLNLNSVTDEQHIGSILNGEELQERKHLLTPLLKASRYCLASKPCLIRLFNDILVQSDILAKEILFEAFNYELWSGHWPSAAINRDNSNLEHVGVFCDEWGIKGISLKAEKVFPIKHCPTCHDAKLMVFKGKLYACSISFYSDTISVLTSNELKLVKILSHDIKLLFTHQNHLYVFDSNEKLITRLNPDTPPINLETFRHEIENLDYALSFRNSIVVFSSVVNNGVDEAAVDSWNTETNAWTKLGNLQFTSRNMISFRSDSDTYILDTNGMLWKIAHSEKIAFTFVAKMWSGYYNVKGAVLFRETLFIFHDSAHDVAVLNEVEGVFSSRNIWRLVGNTSNCIHYVISTNVQVPF